VLESLDFAVNNLKTTLLIVMGHRRCGAVQAAIEAHDNPDVEIGPMLRELRTSVVAAKSMTGDLFENVMRQNVIRVARRLAAENRFAPLISVGKLIIVGAAYDLDTGIVTVIDRT
jgi:carbonic anhydrase